MPARSKAQQDGGGRSARGKARRGKVAKLKGASKSMYESMSEAQLEEFAATPRKGLPAKKKAARR